jgi:hypothetical protein
MWAIVYQICETGIEFIGENRYFSEAMAIDSMLEVKRIYLQNFDGIDRLHYPVRTMKVQSNAAFAN